MSIKKNHSVKRKELEVVVSLPHVFPELQILGGITKDLDIGANGEADGGQNQKKETEDTDKHSRAKKKKLANKVISIRPEGRAYICKKSLFVL